MSITLRRFMPYGPLDLLRGPIGEWVVLILLCGLFIAIAGAILPKRLTEKRYGKAVTIFVGLILGIGLFMSKKLFNFNLESFGFLAIFLIIILMFLVTYGLLKMQFNKDMAVSITYCMIFLTFYIMSPSLFDTFAETLPILNGIFFLTFFYILGKLVFNMVKGTGEGVKDKIKSTFIDKDKAADQGSTAPEQEKTMKRIGGTMKIKDATLKSMLKLKGRYDSLITELNKLNGWMDDDQARAATKALKEIGRTKPIVKKGYDKLTETILKYKEVDANLYPPMVKDARELKSEFHDFYLNVDKGMEHIKDAEIRPGLPILKSAQKNIAEAVQTIQRIRANEPQEAGKNLLWAKGKKVRRAPEIKVQDKALFRPG
jgi:hypothetical protein